MGANTEGEAGGYAAETVRQKIPCGLRRMAEEEGTVAPRAAWCAPACSHSLPQHSPGLDVSCREAGGGIPVLCSTLSLSHAP